MIPFSSQFPSACLVVLIVLCAVIPSSLSASDEVTRSDQKWNVPGAETMVASADGIVVAARDLSDALSAPIMRQQKELYELYRSAAMAQLDERLLEKEAARQNKTVEALLASDVTKGIRDVTSYDAALIAEYMTRSSTPPSPETIDLIKRELAARRVATARENYLVSLRKKYNASVRLEPFRLKLPTLELPASKDGASLVEIVEISDFECPYCRQMSKTINELESELPNVIVRRFLNYPLPTHPGARPAAEFAACADKAGVFWQLRDRIFALSTPIRKQDLQGLLDRVDDGVKTNIARCIDSGLGSEIVSRDIRAANGVGVQVTPTILLNGIPVTGAVPKEALRRMVEEELHRSGAATQ